MKKWMIICGILSLLAAFFKFCMRGYTYISLALVFTVFLIAVFNLGSPGLIKMVSIVTAVGLAWFVFLECLIISNSKTEENPERDYLIVLGASMHGDTVSLSLQHRLEGALEYMEKYPDCIGIMTGGQGKGEDITEAEGMRRWLTERGIPDERIIKEDKSASTLENLQNAKEIILARGDGLESVAILSSGYHLYRAKSMARSLGMDPVGVAGNLGYPIYTLGMFIREAFGITHLWVLGN